MLKNPAEKFELNILEAIGERQIFGRTPPPWWYTVDIPKSYKTSSVISHVRSNFKGRFVFIANRNQIAFEDEEDAVLFSLSYS